MEKMTKREFLNAILTGNLTDEVLTHATEELEKLDALNEKRRNTPSKKDIENAPLKEALVALLSETPTTAADLAVKVELTVQKTSALLRQLVDEGKAVASDVKVPKKGTQKAYRKA